MNEQYYLYTKWTFLNVPDGLDSVGPYHSCMVGDLPFPSDFRIRDMRELVVKQFDTREELDRYWESVNTPTWGG